MASLYLFKTDNGLFTKVHTQIFSQMASLWSLENIRRCLKNCTEILTYLKLQEWLAYAR